MARRMQPTSSSEHGDGTAALCTKSAPMHQSSALTGHQYPASQMKNRAQSLRPSWTAPIRAIVFTALLMFNPASCGKVPWLPLKEELAHWCTLVTCQCCLLRITQQTLLSRARTERGAHGMACKQHVTSGNRPAAYAWGM